MRLFAIESWALWCGFALMAVAAAWNARTLMVPNLLSLPAVFSGWLAALLVSSSAGIPSQGGGIVSSLVGAGVGLALLLPVYASGGLGAGCVKMQAAFGAWVGCALPPFTTALLVGVGTILGDCLSVAGAQLGGQQGLRSGRFPAQVTLSLGAIAGVAIPVLAGWV